MAGRNSWWQAPRRLADRIAHRRVSFLELFYDLVYVVIVSETAHRLSTHMDGHGVLVYAGLFTAIWWAWFNGTMYHDLHGNDDLRTRVFTFLQMIAVAAMAVFAYDAVGELSRQFAFAYAALQLILAFLWLTTGIYDPDHRPLSIPYTLIVLVSAGLFVVSGFVGESVRYTLWLIAIPIALFGSQAAMLVVGALNTRARAQIERSGEARESAVERFGLFTIIVLGEVIVGVVRGLIGHHHLTWIVAAVAALGLLISIGLWWNYFDFISLVMPKSGRLHYPLWMYLHLPMTMGIAGAGAALLHAVEHLPDDPNLVTRLILTGSIAVSLMSIAVIGTQAAGSEVQVRVRRAAGWFVVASAGLSVALGFSGLPILPFLGIQVVLLLVPVAAGFIVWVRSHGVEQELSAAELESNE